MRAKILYDNNANEGFESGWGFSCLIETDKRILFDTGGDPEKLLYNMKKLRIDPKTIDIVIISHEHWDHNGGLEGFMKANGKRAKILRPADAQKFTKISEKVFSTGALKSDSAPEEQALLVKTGKGFVLFTGCSHPGVELIKNAKVHGQIYAIFGGLHDFQDMDLLSDIQVIAACHCTKYINTIKSKFPEKFKEIKAGDSIEIK